MLAAKHNSHHAAIRMVHKLIMYPETHPFSLYILYTLASQQDGSETNPRLPFPGPVPSRLINISLLQTQTFWLVVPYYSSDIQELEFDDSEFNL